MARRRLPPGQRKQLREARLMTVIGLVFVVAGGWGISQGSVGLGVAAVLFFGACLLWGILSWWSTEAELRGAGSEATTKAFVIALLGISVLLGLGCLAAFVAALTAWDQFSFATTVLFPRALLLVAGLLGAALFIGGPIALVLRKGRAHSARSPRTGRTDRSARDSVVRSTQGRGGSDFWPTIWWDSRT